MERNELQRLKQNFDPLDYLDWLGVEYSEEGENIGTGWVGAACPFCVDQVNHFGINIESGWYSCWVCGERGDCVDLVQALEGVGFVVAQQRLEQHQWQWTLPKEKLAKKPSTPTNVIPEGSISLTVDNTPKLVKQWLRRRGFPTNYAARHDCLWCRFGQYGPRLIVPVLYGNNPASFVAADVTGRARTKYLMPRDEEALVPKRSLLYGLDSVRDHIVLVEGVLDQWRVGPGAVALLSKRWHVEQLLELQRRFSSKTPMAVMLDADAAMEAEALAAQLTAAFDNVRLLGLPEGDPADMGPAQIKQLLDL